MKNVLLSISYDGTAFHGWQRQPDLLTVQGEVERVLSILCAKPIKITGTSRTDKGVHALGQIANFKEKFSIPIENIPKAANRLLHPAVQILWAKKVKNDFHSIENTISKTYRYEIINSKIKYPLLATRGYFVDKPLNEALMREASKYIVGTYDFKCFQASGGQEVKSTVRTVNFINVFSEEIEEIYGKDIDKILCKRQYAEDISNKNFIPKKIVIEINGDGFLYKMVRNIVGTLIEIASGKKEPQWMKTVIDSKDRKIAGHTAEPQGLYLKEIFHKDIK